MEIAQINITPQNNFSNLNTITVTSIISALIILILVIASIVLVFVIIGGGIAVITSGGDTQKAGNGRQAIMGGLIGLVVIFAAWAIINLINIFFGINILELEVPSAI